MPPLNGHGEYTYPHHLFRAQLQNHPNTNAEFKSGAISIQNCFNDSTKKDIEIEAREKVDEKVSEDVCIA